jgi:hypothetical protein
VSRLVEEWGDEFKEGGIVSRSFADAYVLFFRPRYTNNAFPRQAALIDTHFTHRVSTAEPIEAEWLS